MRSRRLPLVELAAALLDPRFIERFWLRVLTSEHPDDCWPWTGRVDQRGYGKVHVPHHRAMGAHRVAHTIAQRRYPAGLEVCHHCDQPPCCNPHHLYAGTHRDNMADMRIR